MREEEVEEADSGIIIRIPAGGRDGIHFTMMFQWYIRLIITYGVRVVRVVAQFLMVEALVVNIQEMGPMIVCLRVIVMGVRANFV